MKASKPTPAEAFYGIRPSHDRFSESEQKLWEYLTNSTLGQKARGYDCNCWLKED
jgi:hypothetical protein